MPRIFSYQKVIDRFTTHCLREPVRGAKDAASVTELCTVGGVTYVAIPDFVEMPAQDGPIADTIREEALTDELAQLIKAKSPHVQLINSRVIERIRRRFSIEDELKMIRRAAREPDAFKAYDDFVEQCRAWGKAEKAKLGL